MTDPKISIIILNWNCWKDTIECLESLYRINYSNYEIILVDNGSSDNSISMIKKWAEGKEKITSPYFIYDNKNKPISYFEYTKDELETGEYLNGKKKIDPLPSNKKLFILKNDNNYGFSEGNNIAIKQIIKENISEYLLLLNNDTVVEKNFLTELIYSISKNNSIGIIGPKILNYYTRKVDSLGGKQTFTLSAIKHLHYSNSNYIDYLTGCCLLFKTRLIKNIGLFDKRYFCYFEDADLCYRYKRCGMKLFVEKNSVIYHKVSKSLDKDSKFLQYLFQRNRLLFNIEHNRLHFFFVPFILWQLFIKPLKPIFFFNIDDLNLWKNSIYDALFLYFFEKPNTSI